LIITDRFILLNFPKSGSTFARTVVRRLYGYEAMQPSNPVARRLLHYGRMPLLASGVLGFRERFTLKRVATIRRFGIGPWPVLDPHGGWAQVPEKYRSLPVAMVVRDPQTMVISAWKYGYIQKNLTEIDGVPVRELYPEFPDLDFHRFLDLLERIAAFGLRRKGVEAASHVGWLSIQFANMLCDPPRAALKTMGADGLPGEAFVRYMPKTLTLLRNESLADDLAAFLAQMGYPESRTAFIRELPRINVSTYHGGRESERQDLFTPELAGHFRDSERLLYALLARFGIEY